MNAQLRIGSLGLVLLLAGASSGFAAQTSSLVDGNTAFAFDLYGRLKEQPGNLFFSPYSISTCLGVTYAGARGATATQMARVLHFTEQQAQVSAAFGALQGQLKQTGQQPGIELNTANALWAQKEHPFRPEFLSVARRDYQANVNQTDFTRNAEAARGEVNGWVLQQTKGKIQDLLPPGSVDAMTRLVLANAIYFKGAWEKAFEKSATSPQPFHLTPERDSTVPLMSQEQRVNYMETPDFQAVELPYRGNCLEMVVVLPRQVSGLPSVENQMTPSFLSNLLGKMRRQKVELFLPRFKLESSFKLNDTLARMGMTDAFGANADFSGMDGARDLFISGVFHKAWGEVNEEGTEAAAATGVTVTRLSVARPLAPPPVFRADHPFLFLICENRSGSVLFLGRLTVPR